MRKTAVLAVALLLAGCPTKPTTEQQLRARLGIPADAKTIVIFQQASHLDVDWQHTFDDYYSLFVDQIFTQAQQIIESQPKAVYSVTEMAYLQNYIQQHPDRLAALQADAKRGALHIVGGGMTSPDTVLPETELLMRDFLYGAMFSEGTFGLRAHSAYLPDSFGHAATTPDLLIAAGYDSVAFARVDGAPTLYEVLGNPKWPLAPGSTAATLEQLHSADFLWQGPGGGQILAHYLPHNFYCMGDDIDYENDILQVPGGHVGTFNDSTSFTDGQIQGYITDLTPYARTPYMFVPVGCDFQYPKQQLLQYLSGYNNRNFSKTKTWGVLASFEDYKELVMTHASELPTLATDITPYFMGFYDSRAGVKELTREAARPFLTAEPFAALLGTSLTSVQPRWQLLTRSDHHDFITGTSTDAVVANEQLPLLQSVETAGTSALNNVGSTLGSRIAPVQGSLARFVALNASGWSGSSVVSATATSLPADVHAVINGQSLPVEQSGSSAQFTLDGVQPFSWTTIDLVAGAVSDPSRVTAQILDSNGDPASIDNATKIVLSNGHVQATLERTTGFSLTSLQIDGTEMISAPSFLIHDDSDMGGLWRIGSEMPGCTFTPIADNTSEENAETVTITASSPQSITIDFVRASADRQVRLDAGAEWLDVAITTGAAEGTTRTVSFNFEAPNGAPLRTSYAGGYATREVQHLYTPTFWPAVEWASDGNATVLLRQSTGVEFGDNGELNLMAVRDATEEQCDILGGMGSDTETHRIEWRLAQTSSPAEAAVAAQGFNRPVTLQSAPASGSTPSLSAQGTLLSVSGSGIVTALKPAERGQGVILRAVLLPGPLTIQVQPPLAASHAWRDDAAERDLENLGAIHGKITLDAQHFGSIATVRLLP